MTAVRAAAVESAPLPLYLRGQSATRVSAQGPALVVSRQGKAAARYPLVRISRIIAHERVEFAASALSLCMASRIPLVFVDAEGAPTGFVQPALVAPSRLHGLLCELMDRLDWSEPYQNWLRARRMRLIRDWALAREASGRAVTQRDRDERVRLWLYPAANVHVLSAWAMYEGALASHVSKRLLQAGVESRYWGPNGALLDVRADCLDLVEMALSLEMDGLGATMHGQPDALLTVLHRFGPKLQDQIDAHLASLHRCLREGLETWQ